MYIIVSTIPLYLDTIFGLFLYLVVYAIHVIGVQ